MTTLEAILALIIPADESPGAAGLSLAGAVERALPGVEELASRLSGFEERPPDEQDDVLARLDRSGDPLFRDLVVVAQDLYLSDPRSWPSIGYSTNVPGRP